MWLGVSGIKGSGLKNALTSHQQLATRHMTEHTFNSYRDGRYFHSMWAGLLPSSGAEPTLIDAPNDTRIATRTTFISAALAMPPCPLSAFSDQNHGPSRFVSKNLVHVRTLPLPYMLLTLLHRAYLYP